MCCSGAKWKREEVPDHKFDFVDTRDYRTTSCVTRFQYIWLYILVAKSFLVYVSDVFTAVTMLSTDSWTNDIFKTCTNPEECFVIDFDIGKWLFVGCIIFSFLLLAYEAHKAKKIIASRDISYAFTNVMANNYYSLRSYDHFCFFCHINDSTKKKDDFAFFIFFTFKGWKRLLLADGPRQTINALTLYSFYIARKDTGDGDPWDFSKYFDNDDFVTSALLVSIMFTVVIFAGSLLLLIVAAILYVPLLCYIQGNLKEYCCHKVDKRITELLKRKHKQRQAKQAALARKEAAGDFSHLKNKKGQFVANPLPQPTLPDINLDDDILKGPRDDYGPSRNLHYAPSVRTVQTVSDGYWQDNKPDYPPGYAPDYPPMPTYDAYPRQQYRHPAYGQSQSHLPEESIYDADEYSQSARLTQRAAPIANEYSAQAAYTSYSSTPAPYAATPAPRYATPAPPQEGYHAGGPRPRSGLAYDDGPDYAQYNQNERLPRHAPDGTYGHYQTPDHHPSDGYSRTRRVDDGGYQPGQAM